MKKKTIVDIPISTPGNQVAAIPLVHKKIAGFIKNVKKCEERVWVNLKFN